MIRASRFWPSQTAIAVVAVFIAVYCPVQSTLAASIGDVFVIMMENHNFTQPSSYTSTQAIYGNANAPYLNSLITPNNAECGSNSHGRRTTRA